MYCQQHLFALFYAVLGAISNITQDGPLPTPYRAVGDDHQVSCSDSLFGASRFVAISPFKGPEGPGCAVSLTCPGVWETMKRGHRQNRNTVGGSHPPNAVEPTFKLTLAITNVGDRSTGMHHCESVLEQLILENRVDDLQHSIASVRSLASFQHKATSQEHRTRRWPRQEMPPNKTDSSRVKEAPPSNPLTQGYHGILKYIISKMENGKSRRKRTDASSDISPNIGVRQYYVQRDLYSLGGPTCEDTICEGSDWRTICISDQIPDNKRDQCIMCYPRKHMALIHGYCQEEKYRELDIFYKACALLGASILAATLLYLLREIYKRLRMRYQYLQDICHRSQLSGSTTTKTGLSSMHPIGALASLFPGVSKAWNDPQRLYNGAVDGANTPTGNDTVIRQKFRRFGPFMKDHRKRVQDIFDLEDYQNEPELGTRVPVLPRTRNASIRRHAVRSNSRTNSHSNEDASLDSKVAEGKVSRRTTSQQSYFN